MNEPIGRHFIVGIPGTELSSTDVEFLRYVMPSGVCLFARNIKDASQVRDLTDSIKEILGPHSLICIDQEGGRVDRLRRILEPMPSAESLRSVENAEKLGQLAGEALSMLGINVDFAPVVDVRRDDALSLENGLQLRMMSDDPIEVAAIAKGFLEGLRSEGIAGCLKHFPGLGASSVDSHELLPIVELDDENLNSVDLLPYRELIGNGLEMVMIAHASYPNSVFKTDDPNLPSSLNPTVYNYLRDKLLFDGIAVTDDLEMGAIVKIMGVPQAARKSLESGADIALICNDQNAVREAVALFADGLHIPGRDKFSERLERFRENISEPIDFDKSEWEHLSNEIIEFKSRLS